MNNDQNEVNAVSNANNLLKRIDAVFAGTENYILDVLTDCRAEIASLHEAAQQQAVVIERLSKPYTPSVDALIGEIDGLETFSVSGGHGEPSSQAISVWKLKPILDKYRGAK